MSIPQPIPYQGSKRRLAPQILAHVPRFPGRFIEPFAGSAALTIAIASQGFATNFLLADSLAPLMGIWESILHDPWGLADRYQRLWHMDPPGSRAEFDAARLRSQTAKPLDLDAHADFLFLLARAAKSAPRFNQKGHFNQSPDRRRQGRDPGGMRRQLIMASRVLYGRTALRTQDFEKTCDEAEPGDLVYLDPPYQGTSGARDRRYKEGLRLTSLLRALDRLRSRSIPFLLSFDGQTGTKVHGEPLPSSFGLFRVDLSAGRSAQATLLGRDEWTVESLYLSPDIDRTAETPWAPSPRTAR